MFTKILIALCVASWAYAEYNDQQKEELSLNLIGIKRSVDFGVKIAKIELETEVFAVQAVEMRGATDDQAKTCIKKVTEDAVNSENTILDPTVGKAQPELNSLYGVIMKDSPDSDWDKVKAFVDSFDVKQYRKETKKEFMAKLKVWLNLKADDMKSCAKQ